MPPRPIWEGHLRLSLVNCPVALHSATTRSGDISFHLLHKETHNRVRMVPHDPELGEVDRKDLVKGYEVDKDKYVILTDSEIKNVRLPSTRSIDIERFVDDSEIDRLYWNDPYYLVPQGSVGLDAYVIIREAMKASSKIALGRLVMHTRERIVALEPKGKGILLTTLRSRDEVRDPDEMFSSVPVGKPDKRMLEIAEKIIEQMAAEFEPKEFNDRYEEALRDLIAQKQQGRKPVAAPAPEDTKVVDLMQALKRSLKGGGDQTERAKRFLSARSSRSRATTTKKRAAAR